MARMPSTSLETLRESNHFDIRTRAGTQTIHVRVAASFVRRLIGLLNRRELDRQTGLLLAPGSTIHTFGMRFAIDVVFLDASLRALAIAAKVRPWSIRRAPRGTRCVLELVAGSVGEHGIVVGEQLATRVVCETPPRGRA